MAGPSDLTTLGRIGAAYGIKGWVRLISFTDPAENILNFSHFYLSPRGIFGSREAAGAPKQIEIDESRAQGNHFIGHILGCDDRDQTREYTGCDLQVEKASLPELDKDGYYWFQLEGLKVVNQQKIVLGSVHHMMETGANDVLVVRASEDSIDERERLIPFLMDRVIKQVDLEGKLLRVDWEKDY